MRRHVRDLVAIATLLIFVCWGQWRILTGDRQPVGGDKCAFFYGLMAHYDQCLSEGRLPFWNELWGFGFPGLAESQVGALYPPHVALYSLLSAFDAFRWNLLFHRLIAVPLCFVSLRLCGLRTRGAWLATLIHVAGGFIVGHDDHQWAVEAMVWLPPVFACTHRWAWLGSRTALVGLPILFALQLLIGHFQIAFMTVTACLLYVTASSAHLASNGKSALPGGGKPVRVAVAGARVAGWLAAVALGFGVAAAQLLPTALLANYVRSVNPAGVDYLSTHAQPPWLTANLVFPFLYFRDPLWRDVFWTPLHTAPEECLAYVGLLPLCLALAAVARWRRVGPVRCWILLGLAAWVLSCGPFAPGFSLLVELPGFSFFRSAARWGLIVQFALGLLAGWSVDHASPVRMFRWWRRFLVAVIVLACLLAGWWRLIDGGARTTGSAPAWMNALADWTVPWSDGSLADEMVTQAGTRRIWDGYTQSYWLALERPPRPMRLIDVWPEVWRNELLPSVVAVVVTTVCLSLAGCLFRRGPWTSTALLAVICLFDFAVFQSIFPGKSAPVKELLPDGPALQSLAAVEPGSRVIAPGGNFLQAWGLAPIPGYRTLDVPLPAAASNALSNPERIDWRSPPFSLVGLRAIVQHPVVDDPGRSNARLFPDEQLDWWLDGNVRLRRLLDQHRRRQTLSTSVELIPPSSKAMVISAGRQADGARRPDPFSDPNLRVVDAAELIEATATSRRWRTSASEPAVLVVGELYLPGWSGVATFKGGNPVPVEVERIDGYWQGVVLPQSEEAVVELQYRPPGWSAGLIASGASIGVWMLAVLWGVVLSRRRANPTG